MRLRCVLIASIAIFVTVVDGSVKCFCDRGNCEDALICASEYCVIGLKASGSESDHSQLHQKCGEGERITHSRCEVRYDGWQEVCYCSEDFCNTFAFLRSSIDHQPNQKDEAVFTYSDAVHPVHTQDPPVRHQRSSLIVLLVIIPLSVGGMAVCLIFLNYHCKMC